MSIDLDKRIIKGKKPLTAFDELDSKYIGTDCYFSDNASDFMNVVSNCQKGRLLSIGEITGLFNATKNNSYAVFNYCLPCEWVKEEKKFRPFRLREFLHKFKFGEAIYIRPKNSKTNEERMVIFSEYRTELYKDESNNDAESVCLTGIEHHLKSVVCLGVREYDLTTLFDNYEYFDGKEWKIFGVKE